MVILNMCQALNKHAAVSLVLPTCMLFQICGSFCSEAYIRMTVPELLL